MENESFSADIAPPAPTEPRGQTTAVEEGPKPVRLPGRPSWQSTSSYQLWLVGDRLVHVRCPFFVESCARIALADVQAITVRKTTTGRLVNLFLAAVLGLSVLILAGNTDSLGAWVFFGALAAGCLVLLVLNSVFGPTCECHLRTAVKTHRIAALGRWRSARRTIVLLRVHIEHQQGAVDPDELLVSGSSDLADRLRHAPDAEQAPTASSAELVGPPLSSGRAPVHIAVFGLFLVGVPVCFMDLFLVGVLNDSVSSFMNFVWFAAIAGLSCLAVAQQRGMSLTDGIKSLTWAGLVYLGVVMFVLYTGGVMAGFEELSSTGEGPRAFARGSRSHVVLNVVVIVVNTIIGLGGLVLLHAWQRSHKARVPVFEEGPVADETVVSTEDPVAPAYENEPFEEPE